MVLYFGVGALFLFACKGLERVKLLHKIELKPVEKKTDNFRNSTFNKIDPHFWLFYKPCNLSCSDRFHIAIAKYLAEYNARNCATHTLE